MAKGTRASCGPVVETGYPGLGYQRQFNNWRFVNTEEDKTDNPPAHGPYYATRAALLDDLTRYAKQYGY